MDHKIISFPETRLSGQMGHQMDRILHFVFYLVKHAILGFNPNTADIGFCWAAGVRTNEFLCYRSSLSCPARPNVHKALTAMRHCIPSLWALL